MEKQERLVWTYFNTVAKKLALPANLSQLPRYAVHFIILLNLGITVTLSAILNVWMDEVFSLQTTGKDFGYVLHRTLYFDMLPPLYPLVLKLWRGIDTSIFFARMFSVFCIALTIYLVTKVADRFLKQVHPAWIAAAVAFNPLTIYAAVEMRLYALAILLSVLLLLFYHDGYLSESPKNGARFWYILFSILALYTQYFLGFLLFANGFTLLVLKRWKALRDYLVGMMVVGLCFTPMLFVLNYQLSFHANNVSGVHESVSLLSGVHFLYGRVFDYILPWSHEHEKIWILKSVRNWVFRIGVAFGLIVLIKKRSRLSESENLALLVILSVLCAFFFLVRNMVGLEFLRFYHTAVLFVPTLLVAFSVMMYTANRRILITVSLIILFFNFIALFLNYEPMAKTGDSARVASYIMNLEKPGEPILFFRSDGVLAFAVHYSGPNQLVPLPEDTDPEKFDIREGAMLRYKLLGKEVLRDRRQILEALLMGPDLYERFWLVEWSTKPYLGVDFHPEILEDFIKEYYSIASTKQFYGPKVMLLTKKKELDQILRDEISKLRKYGPNKRGES